MPQYLRDQILDDNHDGSEDAGLADQILEDAEAYVNMYLSAVFTVPLTDAQLGTARLLTLRAALYFSHLRLNTVDDRVETAYDKLTDELALISQHKLERQSEHQEKASAPSRIGSAHRVFSQSSMREVGSDHCRNRGF